MFHFTKRVLVRITSFALCGVLILVGFLIQSNYNLNSAERQIIHKYQAAFEDLGSSMDNMAVTLEKSLYASTAYGMNNLTSELIMQAQTANSALSALPIEQQSVQNISKFISQVSDFSVSLSKKAINGTEITSAERESLQKLSKTASELSGSIETAKTLYNNSNTWKAEIDSILSGADTDSDLEKSFSESEKALSNSPSLIYDGPFSDHIALRESALLKNSNIEYNAETAKQAASKAVSVSVNELKADGEESGTMESFRFKFKNGNISITKRGGYVSYFRKERDVINEVYSYDQAVQTAKQYLSGLLLGNFVPTYYFSDEGVCVVNFALLQADTICYTDLIKVGIAMDNGEVMFYEARGYLMNHHARTIKQPSHTAERAQEIISPYLSVNNVKKALIPTGGLEEKFCYEFHCTGEKNEDVLVYINAETLVEEQLLILLKTDGGTLVK